MNGPLQKPSHIHQGMPKDEGQLYAANELYNRGWFYHREHHSWLICVTDMEPLVKMNAYERGSYICFDPNTWETIRKVTDLVTNPRTKESRGFAFVIMEANEDAERCIKYLNRFVLEGRLITVEKSVVTNLRQNNPPDSSSSGFSWVFDLNGIAELYQSYEETNLWKIVEDVPRGVHFNFLKAERSLHRWALDDLQRIHAAEEQATEEGGGVEMHVLEDAGHWKLKEKAAFRNPDEFFFKMINTKTINGVHKLE